MNIETCAASENSETPKNQVAPRYSLKPGLGAWRLNFAGYSTFLKDQAALHYLAYLFTHVEDLPIHGVDLIVRTQPPTSAGAGIDRILTVNGQSESIGPEARLIQNSFFGENSELLRRMYQKKRELEILLDDENQAEPAKAEALLELESVENYLKSQTASINTSADKAVRSVRRSLNRFQEFAAQAVGTDRQPNAVLRAFAEHIELFVLIPSARYSSFRARVARHGKAGCFTYEPPPGVKWEC